MTRPSNIPSPPRTPNSQHPGNTPHGSAGAGAQRARIAHLDRRDGVPLGRQIYDRVRTAIDSGVLAPGARVASARSLASELGVARGTVEAAYQRLAGEGYLLARGPAGTIVSPNLPIPPNPPATRSERRGDSRAPSVDAPMPKQAGASLVSLPPMPLQMGIPALDVFPRKVWARLAARRVRTTLPADLGYGDVRGERALRQAIAAYLHVSRGVACTADQIFVTAGYSASLALAAGALLRQGDTVWIEDPCYPPTRAVLRAASLTAQPVPVDEEGLIVSAGRELASHARMAVVTPSHQAPLCVSMSVSRRLALLEWASKSQAWILEDDYDGEFHYAGPALPALKSLDSNDRVLYAGSFSKVLFPALSLGYLAVPKAAVATFDEAVRAAPGRSPRLTQGIVADFLAQGHFARHLKKMRLLYARRRTWLVDALRAEFGARVDIDQTRGGINVIMRVRARVGDVTLARRAQQAGLNCQPLSERYANARRQDRAVLMGLTNVASAEQARDIASRLREAFALDR